MSATASCRHQWITVHETIPPLSLEVRVVTRCELCEEYRDGGFLYWLRDPGHAWLAVPLADYPDVLELPELQARIEEYRGQPIHYYGPVVLETESGTVAFLEEDDEARAFLGHYGLPAPSTVVDVPRFEDYAAQYGVWVTRRVEA